MAIEPTNQSQGPRAPAPPMGQRGPRPGAPPPTPAPGPQAAAPARVRPSLKDATRGILRGLPLKILLYGVEGIGKSTFGAAAPASCLICPEAGTTNRIAAFGRLSPTSWEDLMVYLEQLATDPHDYKSVSIDSLDWLEPMCWAHVCQRGGKGSIEEFGYGKGYTAALDAWRVFLARLQTLQTARKMHVILIAHSVVKPFKNPDADVGDYDRYQLKLHDKAAGLMKEWAEFVLFANHEQASVDAGPNRKKGVTSKKHVLYTRRTAAYDAKTRLWIPSEIQLSWSDFHMATLAAEDLQQRYEVVIRGVDGETQAQVARDLAANHYEPKFVERVIGWLGEPAPEPPAPTPETKLAAPAVTATK